MTRFTAIVFTIAALSGSMVYGANLTGNLVCYPTYMAKEVGILKPGLFIGEKVNYVFSPYEFRMDLEAASRDKDSGFKTPFVAFSTQAEMSKDETANGRLKNIVMNRHEGFDNENDGFSGRVTASASPWYAGDSNEIVKIQINATYQKKSWGEYKDVARAEVQVPASAFAEERQSVEVKISAPDSGKLRYFEVKCFRSTDAVAEQP